jgi:hypothetical protein
VIEYEKKDKLTRITINKLANKFSLINSMLVSFSDIGARNAC